MRILVIGGSGAVGRPTAAELIRRGHTVAVLSRRGGAGPHGTEAFVGDLTTGTGLDRALAGVECVIDCANVTAASKTAAVAYFTDTTHRLGQLAAAAGVGHHVVLSIVGIDDLRLGYYQGKLAQERTALAGPVPATVLRATQFHEFAGQMLDRMRLGPVSTVPNILLQPVAATAVAQALAEVVEAGPSGRVPDIAGPRKERLVAMARRLVGHRGQRRLVLAVRIPGAAGRQMREGLLPGKDAVLRGPTFDGWLRDQPTAQDR